MDCEHRPGPLALRDAFLAAHQGKLDLPTDWKSQGCLFDETGQIEMVAPGTFFMDSVHPSTAVHRLIAAFAFGALGASQENQILAAE